MNLEEVAKAKIFVATPVYSMCPAKFCTSQLDLQSMFYALGMDCEFSMLSGMNNISMARNFLVKRFLETDKTHILFIDADMTFGPQDILPLVDFNKDIVGGLYRTKKYNWDKIKNETINGGNPKTAGAILVPDHITRIGNDPIKTAGIGMGFTLIKRGVFEKYNEHYKPPHFMLEEMDFTRYFYETIDNGEYYGEDCLFAKECSDIGLEVYVLPQVKLGHIGYEEYNI